MKKVLCIFVSAVTLVVTLTLSNSNQFAETGNIESFSQEISLTTQTDLGWWAGKHASDAGGVALGAAVGYVASDLGAKGGALLGAKIGCIGGPVGAIVGGMVGAVGGAL